MSAVNDGCHNQDMANMALAVSEAMGVLNQEQSHGFGFEADRDGTNTGDDDVCSDQCEEVYLDDNDDDDLGITREIMGSDDGEELTASRADFDSWMQNHATLEADMASTSTEQGAETNIYNDTYDDIYDDDDDDDEGYEESGEELRFPHSAWANARNSVDTNGDGSQLQRMAGSSTIDDTPISIGSSDNEDELEDYEDEVGEYDDNYEVYEGEEVYTGEDGSSREQLYSSTFTDSSVPANAQFSVQVCEQFVGALGPLDIIEAPYFQHQLSHQADIADEPGTLSETEAASIASAMLFLTEPTTEPSPQPVVAYERPPLPPTRNAPLLADMNSAINQSIDRSLDMVAEISEGCDQTHATQVDLYHSFGDAEETELKLLAERDSLLSRIQTLEKDAGTQTQSIEDAQRGAQQQKQAHAAEVFELRERLRSVAATTSKLADDLQTTSASLSETMEVLDIVSCERTDLVAKCRLLEADIESVSSQLAREQQLHSESQKSCSLLAMAIPAMRLTLAHNKERLLLDTNRALEARLGDALRKAKAPVTTKDALADHRRAWDVQLSEARSEANFSREKLTRVEADLQGERRVNAQLRKRLQGAETALDALEQLERKRKLDAEADERRQSVDSKRAKLAAIRNAVTPTRPGSAGENMQTLHTRQGQFGQTNEAVANPEEFARDRRRRTGSLLGSFPATPRAVADLSRLSFGHHLSSPPAGKPVTPRINLHGPQPASPRWISPIRKPAE
ncbi:hypothetical protein BX661DRAFT_196179 [Kickxella alabastrina]|uniref:uncharacterized protein n=1 Tax=Kickxella alabastrina TaxID=61397 RepID=UPI00221FF447|nr:uncharacterized protein BX661DRAFT_196179 [Kickxella alabastrina]KAI7833661.1 hypothetical protein BX661DRAFT_196179 [Kickxella alabastrina]